MNKTKTANKRAFTLTELLIVVIVIGVLSAVTLPKFNRVIENRKVTEAEEMMSAVRTEQERRCTLDQNYTTNFDSLSDVIASANTKNYTYSLQPQGISAKSNRGDYTLKILSYEDGSYCCTGEGCKKLNKNYPDCAGLSFPESACAGTEGEVTPPGTEPEETPECTDGAVQGSQSCNGCGTQTTQKCVGGKWVASLGSCSKTVEDCSPRCPAKPDDVVKNCECGTVTASHKCDASTNYQWVQEEFPACPSKPTDSTETCSDGKTVRTKTYSCVNNVWTAGAWDKECPAAGCTEPQPQSFLTSCGPCGQQTVSYECKESSGKWRWVAVLSACELKDGAERSSGSETRSCTKNGKTGEQTRQCSSCKWSSWGECQVEEEPCEHGTRTDGTCKEPVMGWRLSSTGSFTIPACSVSPVNASMDCSNYRCPDGRTTHTLPADSRKCGACNASTGAHHCFSVTGARTEQNGLYYCHYTVFNCEQYVSRYQ